jgi:hypothetical protein
VFGFVLVKCNADTFEEVVRTQLSLLLVLRVAATVSICRAMEGSLTYSSGENIGVAADQGADAWVGLLGELDSCG